MKKIAIANSTVRLTANGPWSWEEGREVSTKIPEDGIPFTVGNQAVLTRERVIEVLKEEIAQQKYLHLPSATRCGEVASVQIQIDESTLSRYTFLGGKGLVTSETSGTFVIGTGPPSFVDPPPPGASVPDPVCIHMGSWRVEVPGPDVCAEGAPTGAASDARGPVGGVNGASVRRAVSQSEVSDGAKVELIEVRVETWINDGSLFAGKKTEHVIVIDPATGKLTSNDGRAFVTDVLVGGIEPYGKFVAVDVSGSSGVRLMVTGEAATGVAGIVGAGVGVGVGFGIGGAVGAVGGAVGGPAGGAAGAASVGFLAAMVGSIVGGGAGRAVGQYVMPWINYQLEIAVSSDGSGSIKISHNGFPSYSVVIRRGSERLAKYEKTHGGVELYELAGECKIDSPEVLGNWVNVDKWLCVRDEMAWQKRAENG